MGADIRRSISSRISFRLLILLHVGSWQLNVFCDNASRFSPWVSWIIPCAIAYKNKESKHASLKCYLQELNKMFTLRLSRVGPVVSLTLWCFVVYSTRRFVICLTFCHFISCFSVLLALRLPRLKKRELILVLFVRLFDLCSFVFLGFLFLLVSGKGCGLWLWHSLDFSLTFFFSNKATRAEAHICGSHL